MPGQRPGLYFLSPSMDEAMEDDSGQMTRRIFQNMGPDSCAAGLAE